MKREDIRDLRLQWSQCIQEGKQYRDERKFDNAERSYRRAFNLARKISRKSGKPDATVDVTLKTIVQFYLQRGNYVGAGIYYGLTGLWLVQRWLARDWNRSLPTGGARGPAAAAPGP